jgi:hypothetical protein
MPFVAICSIWGTKGLQPLATILFFTSPAMGGKASKIGAAQAALVQKNRFFI